MSHCWLCECWINKVQYLLWGHGVSQWRSGSLLRKEGDRKSEGQMDGWTVCCTDDDKITPGGFMSSPTTHKSFMYASCHTPPIHISEVGLSCHVGVIPLSELSLPTQQQIADAL